MTLHIYIHTHHTFLHCRDSPPLSFTPSHHIKIDHAGRQASSVRTKLLEGLKPHVCALRARELLQLLLLYRLLLLGQLAKQGVRGGGHEEEDEEPQEQGQGPEEGEGGGAAHD